MCGVFDDSPAWKWMEESVRQKEHKRVEQQILEERKKVEQQILEERQKVLAMLRQVVVEHVSQRFPTLQRLAKAQVRPLDQVERLCQVVIRLSLAQNIDEAQEVLLSLDENDDAEHPQETM